jgi:hypothetical protein
MKPLLVLLAVGLLWIGLAACGGSGTETTHDAGHTGASVRKVATTSTPPKKDRDGDTDNNVDDYHVTSFGQVAGPADAHAITSLLLRYYATAAKEDGAKDCSLLTPFIEESLVEHDGHIPVLKGNTCAEVLTKLFKLNHRDILRERVNMKVGRIGVEGNRARVVLVFPAVPIIRTITMRRQGTRWTVLDTLDSNIE